MADRQGQLRSLPSIQSIVDVLMTKESAGGISRDRLTSITRSVVQQKRDQILSGAGSVAPEEIEEAALHDSIMAAVLEQVASDTSPVLPAVINATGIIIHTGLGRAPLPHAAIEAIQTASGSSPVELDLSSGTRGKRVDVVRDLLRDLTGAESATVVNNNAAAVMLTLAAFARDRGVVVARGELIEIGGSFRIPDVMRVGGAILREVGTTNRVRTQDYAAAIGPSTALLMKIHPSNYRIEGFVNEVTVEDLVPLAHDRGVLVVHDVGSGLLEKSDHPSLASEPNVRDSVRDGADLVLFSGDKLLGGVQAGVIVGRKKYIDQLDAHPMMRALRVDKLTLAGLAATLRIYRDDPDALRTVPVRRMVGLTVEELERRASCVRDRVSDRAGCVTVEVAQMVSHVGGGAVPARGIASAGLKLLFVRSGDASRFASNLRHAKRPLVGRLEDDAAWLDFRTIDPADDLVVADLIESVLHRLSETG